MSDLFGGFFGTPEAEPVVETAAAEVAPAFEPTHVVWVAYREGVTVCDDGSSRPGPRACQSYAMRIEDYNDAVQKAARLTGDVLRKDARLLSESYSESQRAAAPDRFTATFAQKTFELLKLRSSESDEVAYGSDTDPTRARYGAKDNLPAHIVVVAMLFRVVDGERYAVERTELSDAALGLLSKNFSKL